MTFSQITWKFGNKFCSAKSIKKTKRPYFCEACLNGLPVGSTAWRVWEAGSGTYVICEPCWEHAEYCDECNAEETSWHLIGTCRIQSETKPKENTMNEHEIDIEMSESQTRIERVRRMSIAELVAHAHGAARDAGWHDSPRETGTMLMLMVSELGEAMEAARKGLADDKLPHRHGLEVELADTVIRIFDFCGLRGFDLAGAIAEKMEFNRTRVDHSREHRAGEGGKKW